MQFDPSVEQWRPLVSEYVPAQYVDKALWTINYESGGNPNAMGDNGVAVGLFQIQNNYAFSGRPTTEQLLNPAYNVWYAATQLGISTGNFGEWGDGTQNLPPFDPTTGSGKFGALGNHPYPGDSGGNAIPAGWPIPNPVDPLGVLPLPNPLDPRTWPGVGGNSIPNPVAGVGDAISSLKDIAGLLKQIPTLLKGSMDLVRNAIKVFAWLLDPRHWFRIFFIGLGATLFSVGLYVYVRGDKVTSDINNAGRIAAASAA